MTELLPCPFCGSKDVEQDPGSDFVMCNGCNGAAKAKMWNTRQSSEWVSVEDRLPDKGETILVWYKKSQLPYDSNTCVSKFSGSFNRLITHWMPLPQPPITESDDDDMELR